LGLILVISILMTYNHRCIFNEHIYTMLITLRFIRLGREVESWHLLYLDLDILT
jgi:hypothetical protein